MQGMELWYFPKVKILFVSPLANIWEHSLPEALIAKSLKDSGHEVIFVRCNGLYENFCVAMSAAGLTKDSTFREKKQVCKACVKRRNFIDNKFEFEELVIEDFIETKDRTTSLNLCSELNADNWQDIYLGEIPIAKYSAYEFFMRNKIDGLTLPDPLISEFKIHLQANILTSLAAQKIIQEAQPDAIVTSNRLYSSHHAFLAPAELQNIPTYTMQGGDHVVHRSETLTLFKENNTTIQLFDSKFWAEASQKYLDSQQIELVSTHLHGLLAANSAFAYSSKFEAKNPDEIRTHFRIAQDQKVLLVPMSSEDEHNAAVLAGLYPPESYKGNLFEDQFEWIEAILEIAKSTPDRIYIIRLHPRMFPNKRELVLAPIVERTRKLLQNAPVNIRVNTPEDNLSLYDLMQITDVLLNYGSTVGVEVMAFGIPVVAPRNNFLWAYPPSLHKISSSKTELRNNIEQALSEGWSLDNSIKAFRWLGFLFSKVSLDLRETISSKPSSVRPKKPGIALKLWKLGVFLLLQYGPLIRERITSRNATISFKASKTVNEVIENSYNSLVEVQGAKCASASEIEERNGILNFYAGLITTDWAGFSGQKCLANEISKELVSRTTL